jgi:hypothetical protein
MKVLMPILFAMVSLISNAAWSDSFSEGQKAFETDDYEKAMSEWRLSASNGNANAANSIAKMFRIGLGVIQNHQTAIEWFLIGHKLGSAESSYNLAIAYDQGMGSVQKDEKIAFSYYHASAKRGYSNAQYNLGLRYASGIGVKPNLTLSYMWFEIVINSEKFLKRGTIKKSKLELFPTKDGELIMELIANEISLQELNQAKQLARQCVANDYYNC